MPLGPSRLLRPAPAAVSPRRWNSYPHHTTLGNYMPMRSHCIVHFSDIHLCTEGTIGPGVRPQDNLVRALAVVAAQDIKPDFFVLTGDLTDKAEPAAYRELHDIMSGAASALSAEVIYVPGNHDDRATLSQYATGEAGSREPLNQVFWHDGLRVVALDSTVPGEGWGELDARTLAFLTAQLAAPADEGTVIAFHHPPVPSPIAEMARLSLRTPDQLAQAIAATDVRIILCGHYHHGLSGRLGEVPVWVSPAISYAADLTSTVMFRGRVGSAFTRVDLGPSMVTTTVTPVEPENA